MMARLVLFLLLIVFSPLLHAQEARMVIPLGHTGLIRSARFSPDEKFLVTTAMQEATALVWEVRSGKLVATLEGHGATVNAASFNPAGDKIVTASDDKTVRVWEAATGRELLRIPCERGPATAAWFSANGQYITGADGNAWVWEAATGKVKYVFNYWLPIDDAFFGRDGTTLIGHTGLPFPAGCLFPERLRKLDYFTSPTRVQTLVWLPGASQPMQVLDGLQPQYGFTWGEGLSPSYRLSLPAKNSLSIFDARTDHWVSTLGGYSSPLKSAVVSPDGSRVATFSERDTAVKVWSFATGKLLYVSGGQQPGVSAVTFSRDGKWLAITAGEGRTRLCNAATGAETISLEGACLAFSPDSSLVLTAATDGTARLTEVATGAKRLILTSPDSLFRSAAFSTDGRYLVASFGRKTIRTDSSSFWSSSLKAGVWDLSSGRLLHTFHTKKEIVAEHTVFSPDGQTVFTGFRDQGGALWETTTGKQIASVKATADLLLGAVFSPDGRWLVTSTGAKTLQFRTLEGKLVKSISADRPATLLSFSPDGRFLLCADNGQGSQVQVRAFPGGELVSSLKGHLAPVRAVSWHPGGQWVVSASADGTLKIWKAATGETVYTLVPLADRNFLALDAFGRYDGTEQARKMIYYACGREIVELDQFRDLSWEPGLVGKVMGENPEPVTARKLSEINLCNYWPEVEENGYHNGVFDFLIRPRSGGLGQVQLFVNAKEVKVYRPEDLVRTGNAYRLRVEEKNIGEYYLPGGANRVEVKATTADRNVYSRRGIMVPEARKQDSTAAGRGVIVLAPNKDSAVGGAATRVYAIYVGISAYKGEALRLSYAARDARVLSGALTQAAQRLFNTGSSQHVFPYTFTTDAGSAQPTKANIRAAFEAVARQAAPGDILLVYLAGHGVLHPADKQFYYLTREASAFELKGVETEVAVSTEELAEWMRVIKAQKQVLILDACNSGEAITGLQQLAGKREVPADQLRALQRLKDRTGTFILSASASGQPAYETSLYGQGLLTYSLLSGMKLGEVLRDGKFIDVSRWFNFAADQVRLLARDIGGRQDPQTIGYASFDIGLVDRQVADAIPLALKKKVFRRSRFIQDEELLNDDLELGALVDKKLNDFAARGRDVAFVFIADNTWDEAYSIRAKYELAGDKVTVKVSLFRGQKEKVAQFVATGLASKKEELARQIVEGAQKELGK